MKTGVNHGIMMKGICIDFTYIDLQNVPVFIEHSLDCHKNVPVFMEIGIRVLRFSCVFAHCHAPHPIISKQFADRCSGFHVFCYIGMRCVPFSPGEWPSDPLESMRLSADVQSVASSLLMLLGMALLTRKDREGSAHRRLMEEISPQSDRKKSSELLSCSCLLYTSPSPRDS